MVAKMCLISLYCLVDSYLETIKDGGGPRVLSLDGSRLKDSQVESLALTLHALAWELTVSQGWGKDGILSPNSILSAVLASETVASPISI